MAYNAAFEAGCIAKHFGLKFTPEYASKFRCTMLHALYAGYPASLAAAGAALDLPEDRRKLNTGRALIRYFCVPCAPTKSNGGRTRNYPRHAPDRWELFKEYCRQDVVTEMAIENLLSAVPFPASVQKEWETDLIINSRGVAVDMELVEGALALGDTVRSNLMAEAAQLSKLDNPNSVAQLKTWLAEETGGEIDSLNKDTVARMLANDLNSPQVQRMLEIRRELGKTSTKKYDAIEQAICPDGRVRGLLQFYGANRTGRWCLTGDHEVLTSDGWRRLDEWQGGPIACWQPNGETVSFQTAEQVSFDYDGLLYEYNDTRISQKSTPEHKMYIKRAYRGEWAPDTVENMQAYRPSIPFTGWRRSIPGQEHEKLRVLVMTQADGHYTKDGSIRYAFKKVRKIERCKRLLRQADIMYTKRSHTDGRTVIQIPTREIPLWLRQFRDKTFGSWLFDESPDVFFDELVYWDGYQSAKNSVQYTTCNKTNADLVQAFAHMSGRAALMRVKHHAEQNENWNDVYVVDIWMTPKNSHEIRVKAEITDFSGKVYCAVTRTGYFLVRRNGKVWVTGNSGRLVQFQNLPRTYTEPLELARELVKSRKLDALKVIYGSVPDTLSQLIRTAFIASPGNVLIDADFSAIEARVISWLAGEEWRLEVFRTHGKIYEASASQMFGVPLDLIKKGNPEYALRQKGKVAELALGYQGGAGALTAMGALDMGISEDDLPDIVHRWREANKRIRDLWYKMQAAAVQVITQGGSVGVNRLIIAREFDYLRNRDYLTITLPSGRKLYYNAPQIAESQWGSPSISYMGVDQSTKRWKRIETYGGKLTENCLSGASLVLTERGWIRLDTVTIADRVWDGGQWVSHDGLIAKGLQAVIDVDGVRMTPDHKIYTEGGWVCASQSERYNRYEARLPDSAFLRMPGRYAVHKTRCHEQVYDIRNCGQNHRFTVLSSKGPMLVHNCVQAIARDCLAQAIEHLEAAGLPVVSHVHDEVIIDVRPFAGEEEMLAKTVEIMSQPIPWAPDLPLGAEGWVGQFFKKD